MKVAISHVLSRGDFLAESPPNPGRGLESTIYLRLAKADFADQSAVNAYVEARDPAQVDAWLILDLAAAGVR